VGRLQVGQQEDEHRGDHGPGEAGKRRHALAQGERQRRRRLAPPADLLAVAVREQHRVVGAGAEDQDQQQERALDVDHDQARLDQQIDNSGRHQAGGTDREQRQQREDRRPVDEQGGGPGQTRGRRTAASLRTRRYLVQVGGDARGPVT
jgi:hypothetical protein